MYSKGVIDWRLLRNYITTKSLCHFHGTDGDLAMCFYVQGGDQTKLTVDHVTETISFLSTGRSDIVCDLLISMPGDIETPCNEILFLYPNSFFRQKLFSRLKTKLGAIKWLSSIVTDLKWEPYGLFQNCSFELTKGLEHASNNTYAANKYRMNVTSDSHREGSTYFDRVDIVTPSDIVHNEPNVLSGIILTPNTPLTYDSAGENDEGKSFTHLRRLQRTGFTPLSLKLNAPLRPGNSCWIRLRFKPIKTSFIVCGQFRAFLQRITNQQIEGYQIIGPRDVLSRFRERILLNIDAATSRSNTKERDEFEAISRRYLDRYIDGDTTFKRWQLHLIPRGIRALLSFIPQGGHILNQGCLPNFVFVKRRGRWGKIRGPRMYKTYDWEANWADSNNDSMGRFSLQFYARRVFRPYEWLPYMLLAGFLALLLEHLKTTLKDLDQSLNIFLAIVQSLASTFWWIAGLIALIATLAGFARKIIRLIRHISESRRLD